MLTSPLLAYRIVAATQPILAHHALGASVRARIAIPTGTRSQLLDVAEEAEHALLEQLRGTFVVVGQALVGEQMSIAGVQEQLRALDCLDELARGGEVLHRPLVGLHHVDLERNSRRPRVAELGGRESGAEQQGSFRAGTRLGQHLRSRHPEREAGIDELVRQALSGEPTPLADRVEADLLGVANALVERSERLALVEIRGVNRVPGCAELVGERKESGCLSLCVVKEQYLGHRAFLPRPGKARNNGGVVGQRPGMYPKPG